MYLHFSINLLFLQRVVEEEVDKILKEQKKKKERQEKRKKNRGPSLGGARVEL